MTSRLAPPANTEHTPSSRLAPSVSRSWLQPIVARSVCCRSGRSRPPPVSSPSECSSRGKIASGGSSLTRAAASSMASGSPSSLRAMAATAGAFSSSRVNPGTAAAARSANRRTDAQAASNAAVGWSSSSGTASGGTGHSRSPETRSGERLLTRIRTALVSCSSRVTTGAPASRCSKLSSTKLRSTIVSYLDDHVSRLLTTGNYREETGRQLAAACGELSQLTGWVAYDSDEHGLAQRYLTQALAYARHAGDSALAAEILAAQAHQALYLARPDEAVDLARAAQAAAVRHGSATLLTECLVMEAHGHAARNDAHACGATLARAEQTFDRAAREDDPVWLSYFDEAYLAARMAQCFRDLGEAGHAARYARRSLDMDGRYVRGRSFNLSLLATAAMVPPRALWPGESACLATLGASTDSARGPETTGNHRYQSGESDTRMNRQTRGSGGLFHARKVRETAGQRPDITTSAAASP